MTIQDKAVEAFNRLEEMAENAVIPAYRDGIQEGIILLCEIMKESNDEIQLRSLIDNCASSLLTMSAEAEDFGMFDYSDGLADAYDTVNQILR